MNITKLETIQITVPLTKPFKTALRTVTQLDSIFVKITCEDGTIGWGEAPPTHVITGESLKSIDYTILEVLKPTLIGKSLLQMESLFQTLHQQIIGNSSAKAAVDMAIYDCFAQLCGLPLYQLLGGYRNELETDFTVSVNTPEEMAEDAWYCVNNGFSVLKIKVGKGDVTTDISRIKAIRETIGKDVIIRLDANQGWSPKGAVKAIKTMEDLQLDIELIEQPVKAENMEGLKYVTDNVDTLIMADESIFTPIDAKHVLETRSADLINIKLMKAGGIYQAMKIVKLAESYGVECMIGSMIETKLGITAAAHFAASQKNITRFDFDAPLMLARDIVDGGIIYDSKKIRLPKTSGLGINKILF